MVTVMNPTETRIVMENISWEAYERLLAEHPDSASPRFTYDNGWLEIMILSRKHEQPNRTLAQIIAVVAEEMEVDIVGLGSTTFKREDLSKGFEPDSCFYIGNADAIGDKDEIDLNTDPPPDLIIEVDVTSPSLPRFPIFAAVGVPEVWRYDGSSVRIFALVEDKYEAREHSPSLPPLTGEVLTRFLADSTKMKSTAWLRHVRS